MVQFASSVHVRQLGSRQDLAFCGKDDTHGTEWMCIMDGHGCLPDGSNSVIEEANTFDWSKLGDKTRNIQEIVDEFNSNPRVSGPRTAGIGITLSIVRAIPGLGKTSLEIGSIGDSSIIVSYAKSSTPLFINEPRYTGGYLIHPTMKSRVTKEEAATFEIVDDDKAVSVTDCYFYFMPPNSLCTLMDEMEAVNMPGAIGHRNHCYHNLNMKNLEIDNNVQVIARACTDGFWNISHPGDIERYLSDPESSSESLTGLALKRWNKCWNYNPNITGSGTNFAIQPFASLGSPDDVAVGTMIIH